MQIQHLLLLFKYNVVQLNTNLFFWIDNDSENPKRHKMAEAAAGGSQVGGQKLALRVKSKKSQNTILRDVSTKQTVHEFLSTLSPITDVPEDRMIILTGFPPKKVEFDRLALLESLGLSNQDTVIVELDGSAVGGGPCFGLKYEEMAIQEPIIFILSALL